MSHTNLWAPWRLAYLHDLAARESSGATVVPSTCFLCDANAVRSDDAAAARERLVLSNDERGTLLLNRYPYTNGHLLIAPHGHLATLSDLTPEARAGLMELAALGERLLGVALNPQGYNVGINLGRCAGAGLPGHVHVHVVPRWSGDTNFMQTVGQVRVVPDALDASYDHLLATLSRMSTGGDSGAIGT